VPLRGAGGEGGYAGTEPSRGKSQKKWEKKVAGLENKLCKTEAPFEAKKKKMVRVTCQTRMTVPQKEPEAAKSNQFQRLKLHKEAGVTGRMVEKEG